MPRFRVAAAVVGLMVVWTVAPAAAQTSTGTTGQSGTQTKPTGTPSTGSPGTATTGTSTSLALIQAEMAELTAFVEDFVDLFGIEVQTADEARQVIGFATELYFIMKSRQAQGWPGAVNGALGGGSSSTTTSNGGK